MKIGFRKPSFSKSFSAATRGTVNRAIKSALIPGYGKKGVGILNPKRYLYNKIYHALTIDTVGMLTGKPSATKRDGGGNGRTAKKEISTEEFYQNMDIRKKGLQQCDLVLALARRCLDLSLQFESLNKLQGRANRYLDKGDMCGVDLFQFAKSDFERLIGSTSQTRTVNECNIAILIMDLLKDGVEVDDIITRIKKTYSELPKPTEIKTQCKTLPNELLNNPNGANEAIEQRKLINDLCSFLTNRKYGVFVLNAEIKMLNFAGKRCPANINLYDFIRFKVGEQIEIVKKESTKNEYRLVIEIINMLDEKRSFEQVAEYLDRVDSQNRG